MVSVYRIEATHKDSSFGGEIKRRPTPAEPIFFASAFAYYPILSIFVEPCDYSVQPSIALIEPQKLPLVMNIRTSLLLCVATLLLAGCSEQRMPMPTITYVSTISLDIVEPGGVVELPVGETLPFELTLTPRGATYTEVLWSATPEGVVSLAESTLTALGKGRATVTLRAADGGGASLTFEVIVIDVMEVEMLRYNSPQGVYTVVRTPDGSDERLLLDGYQVAAITPDGASIAYAGSQGEIFLKQLPAGAAQQVATLDGFYYYQDTLALSDAGDIYAIARGGEDLVAINTTTQEVTTRYDGTIWGAYKGLVWVGEDRLLAGGATSLQLINTTSWEQQTIYEGYARSPQYLPELGLVAFVYQRSDGYVVALTDLEGSQLIELMGVEPGYSYFNFSIDASGRRIIYKYSYGNYQVGDLDIESATVTNLQEVELACRRVDFVQIDTESFQALPQLK